jgi:hypothetical protein
LAPSRALGEQEDEHAAAAEHAAAVERAAAAEHDAEGGVANGEDAHRPTSRRSMIAFVDKERSPPEKEKEKEKEKEEAPHVSPVFRPPHGTPHDSPPRPPSFLAQSSPLLEDDGRLLEHHERGTS